jgi:hypothetical protein
MEKVFLSRPPDSQVNRRDRACTWHTTSVARTLPFVLCLFVVFSSSARSLTPSCMACMFHAANLTTPCPAPRIVSLTEQKPLQTGPLDQAPLQEHRLVSLLHAGSKQEVPLYHTVVRLLVLSFSKFALQTYLRKYHIISLISRTTRPGTTPCARLDVYGVRSISTSRLAIPLPGHPVRYLYLPCSSSLHSALRSSIPRQQPGTRGLLK